MYGGSHPQIQIQNHLDPRIEPTNSKNVRLLRLSGGSTQANSYHAHSLRYSGWKMERFDPKGARTTPMAYPRQLKDPLRELIGIIAPYYA